jgi:hypothetical protein
VEAHQYNFVSLRCKLDLDLASELCQTVGEELFFTLHIFLEVGKTRNLWSKIWQTLEML